MAAKDFLCLGVNIALIMSMECPHRESKTNVYMCTSFNMQFWSANSPFNPPTTEV